MTLSLDDSSIFDGLMEEDEKDKAKRVSRNKSEKKRRDQFNVLIKELGTMLPGNTRKMDKSTILQKSIDFLRKHKGNVTAYSLTRSSHMYKALSTHVLEGETLTPEYLKTKNQLEFCCHMLRGTIDPKEPPVYEYVKFIGNFKSLNNVPNSTRNGFDGVIQRSLRPAFEDRVCFIATVRLAKPQFIKEMCTVEEPNEEFTSRHSLEWKFLFLDHRAPPIIGYLPFEVLGTSGYDYYHVDDLETLAKCHEHLMQYGKGKSCYYRFLTKGQQWIWLQTQYYITYHQWNSRPEFIVCTHTVVSYAEVRAEQRRELGIEESPPEISTDKQNQDSSSESQLNTSSLKEVLERFSHSRTPSASSRSSRKSSSHTAISDPTSTQTKLQTDRSTPPRQSVSAMEMTPQRRSSVSSQNTMSCQSAGQTIATSVVSQQLQPQQQLQSFHSILQFSTQLDAMQHLKDQLEQRTRLIEANIQRQQEELRQIQEELHRVQGQGLQMFMPPGAAGLNLGSVQLAQGTAVQAGGALTMQGQVVTAGSLQSSLSTGHTASQHAVQQQQQQQVQVQASNLLREQSGGLTQSQRSSHPLQSPQNALPASLYNTMMISQPAQANVVQISTSLAQNSSSGAAVATFSQDRQIRFPAAPQLLTKLVTGPMTCGAVMVPTTMFMGQVVTAFAPQQGQAQTISIGQQQQTQPTQEQQTQAAAVAAPRLLHGNQSTQLILQAAFPLQQQGTFTTTQPQQLQQQQQHQQLTSHRPESLSDRSNAPTQ
uniref:Circadian locomoter output cycles protein kaput-like n=1 Tax=Denticeps clupeoides TaxID=299321 RepID=A0AAY4DD22_9TELE